MTPVATSSNLINEDTSRQANNTTKFEGLMPRLLLYNLPKENNVGILALKVTSFRIRFCILSCKCANHPLKQSYQNDNRAV